MGGEQIIDLSTFNYPPVDFKLLTRRLSVADGSIFFKLFSAILAFFLNSPDKITLIFIFIYIADNLS